MRLFRLGLLFVVVFVLVVVDGANGWWPLGSDATPRGASRVTTVKVALGQAQPRVSSVMIGALAYWVGRSGPDAVSKVRVAGVATARDGAGHVIGSAPVWSLPGEPVKPATITCASTAVSQVLLEPGSTSGQPEQVDVLATLAASGAPARDAAALGATLCAHAAHDPAHLSHPTVGELNGYQQLAADLRTAADTVAAGLPAAAQSLAVVRTALGAGTTVLGPLPSPVRSTARGAAYLHPLPTGRTAQDASFGRSAGDAASSGTCEDGATQVTDDDLFTVPPVTLCAGRGRAREVSRAAVSLFRV
ncbi:hypothetical protein [Streptacidiphilus melanogenes]|uniref:hypothetical protein n=1 Tax=Streptacidiphilus melanogenes TaxID=411235 RepID=UPI0005A90D5A|nr:hypothetical protein [Streptacidiphilus melanogenes]